VSVDGDDEARLSGGGLESDNDENHRLLVGEQGAHGDGQVQMAVHTLVQGQVHAQARNLKLQVVDPGDVDDAERV